MLRLNLLLQANFCYEVIGLEESLLFGRGTAVVEQLT